MTNNDSLLYVYLCVNKFYQILPAEQDDVGLFLYVFVYICALLKPPWLRVA